ncbi:glycosyltransferase [Glycomyces sp. NRRL B-16210]|uniref:glycosyltransferase n=1 Tax=Glycomyces sp. NRRL B-16210 TaxID=1463821 RepID=UPI0004C1BFE3|nr:glycosyltransferase [Glycomyces sp. NRRL B-16210]
MRVLLSTYGSRGDVEPLVGLAARLRELGAEVRVSAPPDAEFTKLIEGAGAVHVPVGRNAQDMVKGVTIGAAKDARQLAAEVVAMRLDMLDAASDCDALLATGLLPAGAREVAERVGIPYVFAAFAPRTLPSPHHRPHRRPGRPFPPGETDNRVLWDIDAANVQDMYGEPLNAHRASVGLAPVANVRDHVYTDRPWLAADPVLGPWPETPELDVVRTGAWFLPDERPLPADLEAFLDAGEPPVYVGFGSMPRHVLEDTAEVTIAAVRGLGRRALVSRGWAELAVVEAAGDCFAVGEANHGALFPRVAAVVHHGGAGTTAKAARAGAPQVVVPQMADQPYWAARVAEVGIGAAHEEPTPTVETLSAALETALDPRTREKAAAFAAQMPVDGAAVAARLLTDLIR